MNSPKKTTVVKLFAVISGLIAALYTGPHPEIIPLVLDLIRSITL